MSHQSDILITGASSGIGEAVARLFAKEGYRVSLGARRLERLQAVAKGIASDGGQSIVVQSDLTRFKDIQRLISKTLDQFGQIDVLLNNAGFGRLKWLEDLVPVEILNEKTSSNWISSMFTRGRASGCSGKRVVH